MYLSNYHIAKDFSDVLRLIFWVLTDARSNRTVTTAFENFTVSHSWNKRKWKIQLTSATYVNFSCNG